MNRLLFPLLSLAVGIVTPSPACMNEYVPNAPPNPAAIKRSRTVLEQLQKHPLAEPWEVHRDRLRKALAAGGDYRVKNDLATALAHTGQAAEAVKLLEQIEAEKPGLYPTASNLGTAYELAGNNEKALEWIRRGIERNPRAHEGTEWLHVRILEAKLALRIDPGWLGTHSIIQPRGDETAPTGNRGEKLSPEQVKAALIYQLHERLQFVHPPDAIVGSLLLNLGGLIGGEPSGPGGAFGVFRLAENYLRGAPNVMALQTNAEFRARYAEEQQGPRERRGLVLALSILAGAAVLLPMLAISLMRWLGRHCAAPKVPATI